MFFGALAHHWFHCIKKNGDLICPWKAFPYKVLQCTWNWIVCVVCFRMLCSTLVSRVTWTSRRSWSRGSWRSRTTSASPPASSSATSCCGLTSSSSSPGNTTSWTSPCPTWYRSWGSTSLRWVTRPSRHSTGLRPGSAHLVPRPAQHLSFSYNAYKITMHASASRCFHDLQWRVEFAM